MTAILAIVLWIVLIAFMLACIRKAPKRPE